MEKLHRLGTTIHTLEIIGNAFFFGYHGDGLVVRKLFTTRPITWKNKLNTFILCLFQKHGGELRSFLVKKRFSNLHIEASLHKGISHTPTNDHSIGTFNEIFDDKNLVADFGSADNGSERALNILPNNL
eukprot:Lithocolla_globosa_v1_NODE_4768_length_1370_cov_15.290494.p4 type:complete len:129 gc:universal NODE_4768_length_1370_cov_15.290494:312-698(+)